ncbi:Putative ribonuclease H protein [Apostasia shenzhenica]|uniref:Ribonuclease H protein n=1 Tax=Apostasia shenzhenica TaxID=1088818 RepID=A0A2I0A277_9ASPA|nr:Putative ribonuclease H protein [Apostasia shenzhenica]
MLPKYYVVAFYLIWQTRNNKLHAQPYANPRCIAAQVYYMESVNFNFNQLENWDLTSLLGSRNSSSSWDPPPPNWLKINFDGAVRPNGEAAAGAILRDCRGQLIQAFGCSLSTYAVDVAELYGAYLAIQLTKPWIGKLHGLWLEGDSETIILLNTALRHTDVQGSSSTSAIIALLLSFPSIRISHVYRQANQAAHYITSASFTHNVFWDRDISLPFDFSAILLQDCFFYT